MLHSISHSGKGKTKVTFARAQGEGGRNKQVKDSAQIKNVLIKKKKKPTLMRVKVTQEST